MAGGPYFDLVHDAHECGGPITYKQTLIDRGIEIGKESMKPNIGAGLGVGLGVGLGIGLLVSIGVVRFREYLQESKQRKESAENKDLEFGTVERCWKKRRKIAEMS